MVQVQANDIRNYSVGGNRVEFSELLDADTTPPRYSGFMSLGNIVGGGALSVELEKLEHFSSKTGERFKDREVVTQTTPSFGVELDEPNYNNLRYILRADPSTIVVGSLGNAITDELLQAFDEEARGLKHGFNHDTIVVKDITGITTYVLDTDYAIVDYPVLPGAKTSKAIQRIATGAIASLDYLLVSYEYDVIDHKLLVPATKSEILGTIRIWFVSDTGNEMIYRIEKCLIAPDGDFTWNDADWSTFPLRIEVLADVDTPSFPYGKFEHYGTGNDF